jgi:hypothetical protein
VDENGNDINPTLYRDAELTLTWDYFGFERNLFRPEGYFEGIYVWNPRSWDHGDIHFNFQELVRTGYQSVIYPSVPVNMYKIASTQKVELPVLTQTGTVPNFSVNIKSHSDDAVIEDFYDLDISFDPSTTGAYELGSRKKLQQSTASTSYEFNAVGMEYDNNGMKAEFNIPYGQIMRQWISGTNTWNTRYYDMWDTQRVRPTNILKYQTPGDYFTCNISNHRHETSVVFG